MQALCKGCANSANAVQGVQMASGLAIQHCMGQEFLGMGFSRDGVLGVASLSLQSVCTYRAKPLVGIRNPLVIL